jgi:hypothetical protein
MFIAPSILYGINRQQPRVTGVWFLIEMGRKAGKQTRKRFPSSSKSRKGFVPLLVFFCCVCKESHTATPKAATILSLMTLSVYIYQSLSA